MERRKNLGAVGKISFGPPPIDNKVQYAIAVPRASP